MGGEGMVRKFHAHHHPPPPTFDFCHNSVADTFPIAGTASEQIKRLEKNKMKSIGIEQVEISHICILFSPHTVQKHSFNWDVKASFQF